MGLQGAEVACEGEVLVGRHVLIAEEDDLVVEQRAPQLGERRVVERRRDVDAVHLGPDRGAERPQRQTVVGLGLAVLAHRSQPTRAGVKSRHRGAAFSRGARGSQLLARVAAVVVTGTEAAARNCPMSDPHCARR
jgi:hypothetical protein